MLTSRLALDVMGGDHAPDAILDGALAACDPSAAAPLPPERIVLVGDERRIRELLAARGAKHDFVIQHASQTIGMDEKPGQALRAKPDSSIAVCVGLVRAGQAGAAVSMGNTGAVVGAATLVLGTLPGVKRPGISVTLNLGGRPITILDMGANVVPKAQHLYQYGVMGAVYAKDCLETEAPRVALLNIGEESSKGTDLLRDTHALFEASKLRFVGNLEPGELFDGKADVVVTDGFTGNVMLKLLEGFAGYLLALVQQELTAHKVQWGPEALARVQRSADYSEYGGALLLGVSGIVVIGHGRSKARAVANALHLAARSIDSGVCQDIVAGLETEGVAPGDGRGAPGDGRGAPA
jgi:glycerol-3-phosphate acyltransferase PlsX